MTSTGVVLPTPPLLLNTVIDLIGVLIGARFISIPNALHIFDQDLLPAAIIEFRSPAVRVAGDSLSGFKGTVIFKKIRDTGRPEGVRRIVRRQTGLFEPPFQHVRGISTDKRPTRELAALSDRGREQRRFGLLL